MMRINWLDRGSKELGIRARPGTGSFVVAAWNNGKHHPTGAGYGLKIPKRDRDVFFRREWGAIELHLAGREQPAVINIDKDSFWNHSCRELISREIGSWLIDNKLAPWPDHSPPRLLMKARGERVFECAIP
jgi:hypothetical protein